MYLLLSGNKILAVDSFETTGGSVIIKGTAYDNVSSVFFDGQIPEDLEPEKYVFMSRKIVPNPDYISNDVSSRLDDIEQIIIELLDTM